MKTLSLLTLIVLMTISAVAKPQQQLGYLVCIDTGKDLVIEKTTELAEVYAIMENVFPGNCINVEKQLYRTEKPVFEMSSGYLAIYVELKIVKRVKRNGELVLRRYKIKH